MKRVLTLVLALALALGAVAVFASCDKTPDLEITEPLVTTEAPPIETDPPIDLPGTDDETETTTEEEIAEATPLDPTALNKEELIDYYNAAVNFVREAKPSYTREERLKVNDFKTSIARGAADGLIRPIVKNMMPGDPEYTSRKKGEDNVDHFFIEQPVSAVRASDVKSITAKKDGANYVITITMGSEVNPERKGNSRYSRVFQIQTRQDVLDKLADGGLTGDAKNCTLTYRDGKAVVTINEKGQIIRASTGFYVDADAKNMRIAIFNPDIVAYQQSNWEYTNFSY